MSNAKFNYSTHSISKRNKIEGFLNEQGIKFEIEETRSITDTVTFIFMVEMPFDTTEDLTRVRETQMAIRNILS